MTSLGQTSMKTYKVSLITGIVLSIEADRYEAEDGMIRLYRRDIIYAEYQRAEVKDIGLSQANDDTAAPNAPLLKPVSRLTTGLGQ